MATALITGASSGIGKSLAHKFAQEGYDLVLVSHNDEKLKSASADISQVHSSIQVRTIAKDLTDEHTPQELYDELKTKGIQIDILVNNAGIGYGGEFSTVSLEKYIEIIRLNVEAVVRLTHLFLPDMLARNDGKILTTGSVAGFQPGPLMSVYYASKAFVVSFCEALAEELKDTGVGITCLCPGPTDTNFFYRADLQDTKVFKEQTLMEPEKVADAAYKALMDRDRIIIPGAMNKILTFSRRVMPATLQAKIEKGYYEESEEVAE